MDSKQTNIGPFRIQATLRREGGATVYRVLDTRINHPRLLYTFELNSSLGPIAGEALLDEARAMLHLQHEHLIAPREADRDGDLIYVATEPLNGISLADHLYQMGGILALSEAADIIQDVAECLDYVHREGLVHGRLTPGEIWLTTNGQAKLAGIGLPSAFSTALAGAATDAARGVALTPYTAPEQAASELATDQRVDVYSLGAVAFAMLTGSAPFDENADNLRDQIAYRPPTPPETLNLRLPPNVASVLRFVLAKDPNARYARAGEFAAALRQAQLWSGGEFATLARSMPSTGRRPASGAGARRQRNLVALFALLLVVVLAGILLSQRAFQREASGGQEALTPASTATALAPVAIAQVDEETPADANTLPGAPEAEDDPPAVSDPSADAPTTDSVIADDAGISATETITESANAEIEPTATATDSPASTDTNTPAPTATETSVPTTTLTPTATDTSSVTPSATATPTEMPPPTDTTAPTLEVAAAAAQSLILVPTDTPSATPELEATATATDTAAPTNTHTATATETPLPTSTPAPTNTHTATATETPPPTDTPAPTNTHTATATDTPLPTSTPTPTNTHTATATDTPPPTDTPAPTNTPTATATDTPPPTDTPAPTNTRTITRTPTRTPTRTSTRTPTRTPAPTNTPTHTPAPTNTPTPTVAPPALLSAAITPTAGRGTAVLNGAGQPGSTIQVLLNDQIVASTVVSNNGFWSATVPLNQPGQYRFTVRGVVAGVTVNAATAPVSVVVPAPLPTPTPTIGAFRLVAPAGGETGTGSRVFEWETSFVPGEGEGFEIIFWRIGQDPMTTGFGLAAPTLNHRVSLNLSRLDEVLGQTFEPGPHNWGILLVRTDPYQRLRLLSEPRTFIYSRSDSGSSGGGGQSSGEGGGQSSGE